jgi:hypothetical protein
LPALLAATERAVLDEERSVVIIAADADEVARWIAAVSFLLPPPLVARMSFATYQFRPSYSRHHVIGTVPGAEIVPDERAFEAFYLFDFTAGRAGTASAVEAGPLPLLLAGAGTVAAESLWRHAAALATGAELRLADWYPPAVAAALLDEGVGIGPQDLDVVCAWLGEHARRLGRDAVGRVGAAVLDHDAVSTAHLTGLADAAAADGLHELLAAAERHLLTACLTNMNSRAGAEQALRNAAPLRSASVREFAGHRYARLLGEADADTMVRLLKLAHAHEVRPDPRVLRDCGQRVAGPQLLRSPSSPEVHEAVRQWPDLRAGTLAFLDGAAEPDATCLYPVFEAGLDAAVDDADLAALPALREAALVARARRDPEQRVDVALSVVSGRGPAGRLDDALLNALWPERWSLDVAMAMLSRLPREAVADPLLVPWVAPLLSTSLSEDDHPGLESFGALCDLLEGLPLTAMLPSQAQDRLKATVLIRRTESRLGRAGGKIGERERLAVGESLLAAYDQPAMSAAKDYLRIRLVVLLPTLPHETLAALLARAPGEIRTLYLSRMERRLGGDRHVAVSTAAAAFTTMCGAPRRRRNPVADGIEGVLLRSLPRWRKRDLNAVEREVRRTSKRMAEEFKRWRQRHCAPRRRWLMRRLSQD